MGVLYEASNTAYRIGQNLKLKSHIYKPELCLAGGLILLGGSIITAIAAGTRYPGIIEDHNERLAKAKGEYITEDGVEVTDEKKKDALVAKEYAETAINLAKVTLIPVGLGLGSAYLFTEMYSTQKRTIEGLSATVIGMKEYISRYEKANAQNNGTQAHEKCHSEAMKQDDDEINVVPSDHYYEFSRRTAFSFYTGDPSQDRMVLNSEVERIKRLLRTRSGYVGGKWRPGVVTVNEVLNDLGMNTVDTGYVDGWVYGCGDDPSIIDDAANREWFLGHRAECVYLRFNVHGNVLNLIKKAMKEGKKE